MTEAETIITGLKAGRGLMKKLMTDFQPRLDQEGLNSTHFRTLVTLSNLEKGCMKVVCRKIGIEAGSFTPVADKLMEEGLVVRMPDEKDRRKTFLALTEKGCSVTDDLKKQMEKHIEKRLARLSEEGRDRFLAAMETLVDVDRLLEENSNE